MVPVDLLPLYGVVLLEEPARVEGDGVGVDRDGAVAAAGGTEAESEAVDHGLEAAGVGSALLGVLAGHVDHHPPQGRPAGIWRLALSEFSMNLVAFPYQDAHGAKPLVELRWSPRPGSNRRHLAYKASALPTELQGRVFVVSIATDVRLSLPAGKPTTRIVGYPTRPLRSSNNSLDAPLLRRRRLMSLRARMTGMRVYCGSGGEADLGRLRKADYRVVHADDNPNLPWQRTGRRPRAGAAVCRSLLHSDRPARSCR